MCIYTHFLFKYNLHRILYLFQMYNIVIQQLNKLQNDNHSKSGYHVSPHKVIRIWLSIFPMLYITSPWLIYFITGSVYFLIPFTHFAHTHIILTTLRNRNWWMHLSDFVSRTYVYSVFIHPISMTLTFYLKLAYTLNRQHSKL